VEDSEIVEYLTKADVSEDIAFDIVIFTPIAFCRKKFDIVGIKFPDKYYVYEGENMQVSRFSESRVYEQAVAFYVNNVLHNYSDTYIMRIVGRSAEFDAIVQALEANVEYESMVIDPMRFYY
jgi:hypothetical protein